MRNSQSPHQRPEVDELEGQDRQWPNVAVSGQTPTTRELLLRAKRTLCASIQHLDAPPFTHRQSAPQPAGDGEANNVAREANLEAEVLLSHVLGITRTALLARPALAVSQDQLERFRELLARRLQGEPVAYLTGHREFFGLDFLVDRRVLIPRPETELLVETALAECFRRQLTDPVIADIGTGSGAIAIALAKHLPYARVYAVDVSIEALAVAAINARRHGILSRVNLLHGDLLAPVPEPVDLIVANLPYVSPEAAVSLPRDVAYFEPPSALIADDAGLSANCRLLAGANRYLRPAGAVILEVDPGQCDPLLELARQALTISASFVVKDYGGLERMLLLRTGS